MKRLSCIILSLMLLFSLSAELFPLSAGETASSAPAVETDPFSDVTTPYLYLMEVETGAVLYSRRGDEKAFPASTTKVMTALVAAENIPDLNKYVTLGWRPVAGFGPTSSLMGLVAGEKIRLIDILYGLMLRSGNDAAKALAIEAATERYGSDIEPSQAVPLFVELMNEKAAALGMTSTHFATVDGRHDDEHYTTPKDFAILMREALKHPLVSQVMATPTYQVEATNKHPNGLYLENSNKLICQKSSDKESYLYKHCIGGKTGETNNAGYCLLSAARRDDVTLVLVQFGDSNTTSQSQYRYETAKRIYDWGFQSYRAFSLAEFPLTTEFELQASNASSFDQNDGRFTARARIDGLSVTGAYTNLSPYMQDASLIRFEVSSEHADAPIRKGDVVGYVDYYFYGDSAVRAELVADRAVASASGVTSDPRSPIASNSTPPPSSGKSSELALKRRAGDDRYGVWLYYDGSLYTMDSAEWHYLHLSGGGFRTSASVDSIASVELYRRCFDESGNSYYQRADSVSDGGEYVIVSDGAALSSEQLNGTLAAVPVGIGSNGLITTGVSDSMIWRFESSSNGYHITNSSHYLVRKTGSGILFWVLIAALVIGVIVTIQVIRTRRSSRARHSYRRRSRRRRRALPRYRR